MKLTWPYSSFGFQITSKIHKNIDFIDNATFVDRECMFTNVGGGLFTFANFYH